MKCSICGEASVTPEHWTCIKPPDVYEPEPEPTEAENIVGDLVHARANIHQRKIEDWGTYVKFEMHWVEQLNWDQNCIRENLPEKPVPTHRLYKMFKNGREEFIRYLYE